MRSTRPCRGAPCGCRGRLGRPPFRRHCCHCCSCGGPGGGSLRARRCRSPLLRRPLAPPAGPDVCKASQSVCSRLSSPPQAPQQPMGACASRAAAGRSCGAASHPAMSRGILFHRCRHSVCCRRSERYRRCRCRWGPPMPRHRRRSRPVWRAGWRGGRSPGGRRGRRSDAGRRHARGPSSHSGASTRAPRGPRRSAWLPECWVAWRLHKRKSRMRRNTRSRSAPYARWCP
mmetsp:Transcript_115314/g.372986  ORF Transcript_115314/g.372986 Transcript_115314/m.372986 type:complete len:230 (-) Transcript_115314:614-1303(-)